MGRQIQHARELKNTVDGKRVGVEKSEKELYLIGKRE